MIRADRELLADLARMNSDVAPLAMRIMDGSATLDEQRTFAARLIELGTRLNHRARQSGLVIDCDTAQEPSPQADEACGPVTAVFGGDTGPGGRSECDDRQLDAGCVGESPNVVGI